MSGSPLHSYLQAVYREQLPPALKTPLLSRSVRWLYHTRVGPNASCKQPQTWRFDRRRACSRARSTALWLLHRDMPQPVVFLNRYGYWLPTFTEACATDAFKQTPIFAGDDEWIEVTRLATRAFPSVLSHSAAHAPVYEGGDHGCWFLAAPGSGVFLHTGRSLRVENRSVLARRLGLEHRGAASHNCTPGHPLFKQHPYCLEVHYDLCGVLRSSGLGSFDTIQILDERFSLRRRRRNSGKLFEREIISCQAGCRASTNLRGPCVDVPLRTGWNASQPCVCDDSIDLLNCLGTSPTLPAPSATLKHTVHNVPPALRRTFADLPLCTPIWRNAWTL